MFSRTSIKYLRQWAAKEGRKPLVLRGARQVGKTTLVRLFAQEFDTFISLNLEEKENAELFSSDNSFKGHCWQPSSSRQTSRRTAPGAR